MDATEKLIRSGFPGRANAGLRRAIREALPSRSAVSAVGQMTGLTIWGWLALSEIIRSLPEEFDINAADEDDEVGWSERAAEHQPDCEWVLTRAHTRPHAED